MSNLTLQHRHVQTNKDDFKLEKNADEQRWKSGGGSRQRDRGWGG